jgi:hypothetical protein
MQTAALHEEAAKRIKDAGVSCLGEIEEVA